MSKQIEPATITTPIGITNRWDLPDNVLAAHNLREDAGQKKYGRGKQNAGWHRDNLQDVFEELSDALVIFDFFQERLTEGAVGVNATTIRLYEKSKTLQDLIVAAMALTDDMHRMSAYSTRLTREKDVKRIARLREED